MSAQIPIRGLQNIGVICIFFYPVWRSYKMSWHIVEERTYDGIENFQNTKLEEPVKEQDPTFRYKRITFKVLTQIFQHLL